MGKKNQYEYKTVAGLANAQRYLKKGWTVEAHDDGGFLVAAHYVMKRPNPKYRDSASFADRASTSAIDLDRKLSRLDMAVTEREKARQLGAAYELPPLPEDLTPYQRRFQERERAGLLKIAAKAEAQAAKRRAHR